MNFFSKLGLTGLMLASSSAFAVEPAEGWYAGFMVGVSWPPKQTFSVNNPFPPPTTINGDIDFGIFGNLAGQVGYRCGKFRYEGELYGNYNPVSKLTFPGGLVLRDNGAFVNIEGNTSLVAGIFNVFYEFYDLEYEGTKWVPYVGLGLGYGYARSKIEFNFGSIEFGSWSRSGSAPVGQGILGLSYFFNDNISMATDIRYTTTNTINAIDSRVAAASWNLLMNFSFDQPY